MIKYRFLGSIRDWYSDSRFSRAFRKCVKIQRELELRKTALEGTVVNEYTESFVQFLKRRIETLEQEKTKAGLQYNKVVESFRH